MSTGYKVSTKESRAEGRAKHIFDEIHKKLSTECRYELEINWNLLTHDKLKSLLNDNSIEFSVEYKTCIHLHTCGGECRSSNVCPDCSNVPETCKCERMKQHKYLKNNHHSSHFRYCIHECNKDLFSEEICGGKATLIITDY